MVLQKHFTQSRNSPLMREGIVQQFAVETQRSVWYATPELEIFLPPSMGESHMTKKIGVSERPGHQLYERMC